MLLLKRTLIIIAICLAVVVLFLLRRPPRSTDAAITRFEEELLQGPPAQRGPQNEVPQRSILDTRYPSSIEENALAVRESLQNQPAEETTARERLEIASTGGKQAGAEAVKVETPVGVVDARNCVGLNYSQIMQGTVSVRMVWNGHTFVPQKVCVVKEGDSAASVWSFEQSSGAIISELPAKR